MITLVAEDFNFINRRGLAMTQLELPEIVTSEPAANEVADAVKTKKAVHEVRLDGGTQPRERLDEATVARYAEEMTQGLWDFSRRSDRPVAFFDGTDHWLADGYHRLKAASHADRLDAFYESLEVRQGTVRNAVLYSVSANARHGFPRSNEDKRRAVTRLLKDSEWANWSDREIARQCHVDHRFVAKLKAKLTGDVPSKRTYTTKHGTPAVMKTGAIGRRPERSAKPAADTEPGELTNGEPDSDLATTTPDLSHDLAQTTLHADEAAAESRGATEEPHGEPTAEPAEDRQHKQIPPGPAAKDADMKFSAKYKYYGLRDYLSEKKTPRPSLPATALVEAMNVKERANLRRAAEKLRTWAVGLLDLLNTVDGNNT